MNRPLLSRSLSPFRRLQWRLTLSYTLVTVAALVVVELLIFLALLALVHSDFLVDTLTDTFRDEVAPQAGPYLSVTPPDVEGLNRWLTGLFRDGRLARDEDGRVLTRGLNISFEQEQAVLVLDAEQRLLAQRPAPDDPSVLGQPFDVTSVEGLPALLPAALRGETERDQLRATRADRLLLVLPIRSEAGAVVGTLVVMMALPAFNLATLGPLLNIILISVIPLTLAAGLIGTVFGFLTARNLSRRLHVLATAADAWSQGDFSVVVHDRSGDELGQLSRRLNRMAEQLQNLLQTYQELATLEERNRLARDLHDSVKQQVFATAMQVGAARALLATDPEAAGQHLAEAEQLARQAQQELTGLIQELRPAALAGKGLVEALRAYTADWSRRTGIQAGVRVQGERPLPLPVEQALFRVAQEALANVARHSGAQTADVHLAWTAGEVTLTISDDGRGFDPAAGDGLGLGTRSMAERIEAVAGQFKVESVTGKGTRVVATVKHALPERTVNSQQSTVNDV